MKILRVQYKGSDTAVTVAYEQETGGHVTRYQMKCDDAPRPSLWQALQALRLTVCRVCDFPEHHADALTVVGVGFSYSDGVRSTVIAAVKELSLSRMLLGFNTPTLPEKFPDPELLDTVHEEATAYVHGERAQADMFAGDADGGEGGGA